MFRLTSLASVMLLLACFDLPHVYPLRPEPVQPLQANLPTMASPPDLFLAIVQATTGKKQPLEQESKIALIRYVDGEFARVVQSIPSVKQGFRYKVGQAIDARNLRQALMRGAAANPGDHVQISSIEFRSNEIIIGINGGTKKHWNWRQHVQIGMGPMSPPVTTMPTSAGPAQTGAVLILDYGHTVPNLSPDELKHDLSPFLDFAGEHSSAVNWVDTLPPQFQQAIKDHRAIVGMNHDMVLAAMGRPDKKVREFDEDGKQTEDWIYGYPPSKTVLVTFSGEKVIHVKTYS
ncbi:MAG TPA: hypothetical protein VGS27_02715 [Candidatus Sulfotelmatobacter sp.]|nr:hypothetical protein [Candidatus Acidoferrales bacterium]HEV2395840.1 hypothetical protein [Candidatus Sulfotelmatobacter sp.]